MVVENFSETLSDVSVDHYCFRATRSPFDGNACILWFRDSRESEVFKALGRFACFEKRNVLEFIARYATSAELRGEIEKRRFQRRLDNLEPAFFEDLERLDPHERKVGYRHLFDLDSVFKRDELDRKRRLMAKRFHPDVGGRDRYMAVINEAYDSLLSCANA